MIKVLKIFFAHSFSRFVRRRLLTLLVSVSGKLERGGRRNCMKKMSKEKNRENGIY